MRPPTKGRKVVAIAIIGVLGVVVAVLCGVALTRGQSAPASEALTPTTTSSPIPSASPTTASTPTPTPALPTVAANRADERFLSYAGATAWRATAGSCEGTAPLLQRMNAQGVWADITPREYALRQITSLDAHADGAELVGGVDDACTATSLRTFSAGAQWAPFPDILTRSRYVNLADAGIVHTRNGDVAAPCADASGLRASGDLVALICDGTAWLWANDTWGALELANVKALAIDETELVVGHQAADCAGLALTRVSGADSTPAGCAENVDLAQPIAIAANDSGMAVWAADTMSEVAE